MSGPRLTVLILAAAFVLSAPAAAGQRATAGLERIERADVEAGDTARESRVCLDRGGAFVLAFRRHADNRVGVGSVLDADGASLVWIGLLVDSERQWTWHQFSAEGCVTVRALGGRARLYRLTVGVNW